jgi:glycerol-3-phosphate cytidylyltransferase-like family protein
MTTKKEKIVVVSGEFDSISLEELNFLKKCRKKGDWLIVGLHSDNFLELCRGGFTLNFHRRKQILESIRYISEIFEFDDSDGTVCNLLKLVKICYPNSELLYISNEDMHNMPETKIRGITFEVIKLGDF